MLNMPSFRRPSRCNNIKHNLDGSSGSFSTVGRQILLWDNRIPVGASDYHTKPLPSPGNVVLRFLEWHLCSTGQGLWAVIG